MVELVSCQEITGLHAQRVFDIVSWRRPARVATVMVLVTLTIFFQVSEGSHALPAKPQPPHCYRDDCERHRDHDIEPPFGTDKDFESLAWKNIMLKKVATNVAGRNTIVTAAMVFMAVESRRVSAAIFHDCDAICSDRSAMAMLVLVSF